MNIRVTAELVDLLDSVNHRLMLVKLESSDLRDKPLDGLDLT